MTQLRRDRVSRIRVAREGFYARARYTTLKF